MAFDLNKSASSTKTAAVHIDANQTLENGLSALPGDPPASIPFLVWLLENPDSPVALPGKISLYCHDCMHLLLDRGFSSHDEAFVIGFTMGNDIRTGWIHMAIFRVFALFFYPKKYAFRGPHLKILAQGVAYGRAIQAKNLNQIDWYSYREHRIKDLRQLFGIENEILDACR